MAGLAGASLIAACAPPTAAPPAATSAAPTAAPKSEATQPAAAPAAPAAATQAAPPQAAPTTSQVASSAPKSGASLSGVVLNVLQSSGTQPATDPFQKEQAEQLKQATGLDARIEFANQNEVLAKISASIQAGTGPDVYMAGNGQPHILKAGLVDVSDVAAEVKGRIGDFYTQADSFGKVDGKYLGIPHNFTPVAMHWRRSWYREVGVEKFPTTYDELHAVGAKLKANGHPIGQAFGHSVGDPPFWCYPMLWAYGGREVDEQGKVAINSPETVAAVTEMKRAFPLAYDESGTGWDDTGNNRAFLGETVSTTLNAPSIWFVAKKDGIPFFEDIALDVHVAGPKGRVSMGGVNSYTVLRYSKQQDAAKYFLNWALSDAVWYPLFKVGTAQMSPIAPKQNESAPWSELEPALRVFKEAPANSRAIGWPGPPDDKASLTLAKYVIIDMFAKALLGASPEEAVAWAENEMKQIYG